MMKRTIVYSGLTTKIRAMRSNLITPQEYETIANLTSVPELFAFLQKHPGYSHLFGNMDGSVIHRGDIEAFLRYSTYRDFVKIYNFATGRQRRYLDCYFMKYEIEVLKRYLRNLFDSREDTTLTVVRNDFERKSKINTKVVAESRTIEEFIRNLQKTPYYEPLLKLQHTGSQLTLFDYEMCLDLFYFTTVWKRKEKYFKGDELETITRIYGSQIDMLNIIWIYRTKKFYNLTSSQIFGLLIPVYYKIRSSELLALVEADSLDSFFQVLSGTYYRKQFTKDALAEYKSMERIEEAVAANMHNKDFKKQPYSISCIITYLFSKEKEVHNLITATECIRYGYAPGLIMKNIV